MDNIESKLLITSNTYNDNEVVFALTLKDNKLDDINIFDDDSKVGNIYCAKVDNILNNINAAFVVINNNEKCYYSLNDNKNHIFLNNKKNNDIKIGDEILVQLEKDSSKGKLATVSSNISLTGKYIVFNTSNVVGVSNKISDNNIRNDLKNLFINNVDEPSEFDNIKFGCIFRTDAIKTTTEDIVSEIKYYNNEFSKILKKAKYAKVFSLVHSSKKNYVEYILNNLDKYDNIKIDNSDIYQEVLKHTDLSDKINLHDDKEISLINLYNLQSKLQKLLERVVYLKSGASIVIEHTEAMTVIDVNTKKAVKSSNSDAHIFNINKEACDEIIRQLRLRNISGIIIIDFINMKSKDRIDELLLYITNKAKLEKVPTYFVDITKLGLVELTRKKVNKPNYEYLKAFF